AGPQGPEGPIGATGPAGPQGATGVPGAAGVSGYRRQISSLSFCPSATTCNKQLGCSSGTVVLSGGMELVNADEITKENVTIFESYPTGDTTWKLSLKNSGNVSVAYRLHLVCITAP
ncbi:MAG: collagen-like protein, partial [Deltaproteobacteria bacterium]|nr:collagen-like protein [Deltaproteobacteria bacterium]